MTIDDKQLDAWLRDVEVPQDLNERLLAIPQSASIVTIRPKRPLLFVASILAIAASVVGIAIFVQSSNRSTEPAAIATNPELVREIDEIKAEIALIEQAMHEAEIRKLSEKFEALSSVANVAPIDRIQRTALIVSLSDQSALQLGASQEWVKSDMTRVIQRFPNTDGANHAQQFIAQIETQ